MTSTAELEGWRAEPSSPTAGSTPTFRHRPGLDALRGLAVVLVVAFHSELGIARGGYLGVSTFFTLSGFLIATLALLEHGRTGRFSVVEFWRRRFRRLLPAAVLAVALVVVLVAAIGPPSAQSSIAGDSVASLLYVANWRMVLSGVSYADLFSAPSPLVHLWSLAVEEQFYVLFPVVLLVLLPRRTARPGAPGWSLRARLAAVAAGVVVVSTSLPVVFRFGADRTYYGTDSRAAEIAVGILLATVLLPSAGGSQPLSSPRRRLLGAAAVAVLVAMAVVWATVPDDAPAWRHGGFLLYAIGSAVLIAAAVHGAGPFGRPELLRPLCRLGVLSYAIYLLHWPVLWALDLRVDWPPLARFVVVLGLSTLLAELSLRFVEMPIRRTGRIRAVPASWAVPAVATAVVAGAVVVASAAPPPVIDFAAAEQAMATMGAEDPPATASSTPSLQVPAKPKVAVFGDSTALMMAMGIDTAKLSPSFPAISSVKGFAQIGCGLLPTMATKVHEPSFDTSRGHAAECARWRDDWTQALDAADPDLAVLVLGRWEVVGLELPGLRGVHRLGDPAVDDEARTLLAQAIATLSARGARVALVTTPELHPEWSGAAPCGCEAEVARWNELLREQAANDPAHVQVVDLAGWLASLPAGEDRRLRPDGVHFSQASGAEVASRWLAGELLAAAERPEAPSGPATTVG